MKLFWLRLSTRIDALALRERIMLFAAVLAAVVFLSYWMVLSPMFARQELLSADIARQQASIAQVEGQISAIASNSAIDPDAGNRELLASLQAEVRQLGNGLRSMQESLVAPDRIAPLLETMLRSNTRLKLVSLRTLPATGLSGSLPAGATAVAQEARAPKPEMKLPELVYRHGVELTLEGQYADMVNYMSQLEAMPVRLIWGEARLDAANHPRSRLTLTLFTLSLEKDWMKL